MPAKTLVLAGHRFVIVPEKEYKLLLRQAARNGSHRVRAGKSTRQSTQDRGDIAEANRRRREGPARPYHELRKELGLA